LGTACEGGRGAGGAVAAFSPPVGRVPSRGAGPSADPGGDACSCRLLIPFGPQNPSTGAQVSGAMAGEERTRQRRVGARGLQGAVVGREGGGCWEGGVVAGGVPEGRWRPFFPL